MGLSEGPAGVCALFRPGIPRKGVKKKLGQTKTRIASLIANFEKIRGIDNFQSNINLLGF